MKKILVPFFVLSLSGLFAQKQADVSLELLDGNIIKGTAMVNDIDLVTAYGKLVIPVSKINHIEVGIGRDNAVAEKAKGHLKILATSNNEDTRKSSYTDLVKLGIKAIPAINDFFNDPKNISEESTYTGEYTIDNALTEIKASGNMSHEAPIEDIITMDNNYTMGGSYNFIKMDVKTEYGNLSVPKEKIKSIDVSVAIEPGKGDFSFKLLASKNITGNTSGGWLKTGVMLKAGQRFTITANGEVTLASLSNSKYKPDGSSKAESATEFTKPYGSSEDDTYSGGGYPTYGQVVYKIGDTSTENLKAGAKFNGTAKTSGMLLISIYETVYNANNKGAYNVKVSLGK
ncbi:MAG: hypothetical protein K0S32_353 [Bacteroidetes bacterium]|jgi:hypothetical protein|nr:hypothetical protein [Bacteroidota bacterium]